jgi:hypothetical protein
MGKYRENYAISSNKKALITDNILYTLAFFDFAGMSKHINRELTAKISYSLVFSIPPRIFIEFSAVCQIWASLPPLLWGAPH